MTQWEQVRDTAYNHTAVTKYVTDGFVIWKGKYRVYSVLYSANEWHITRLSDGRIIYSAKTAKECRRAFETSIKNGINPRTVDGWLPGWSTVDWEERRTQNEKNRI